MGPIAGRRAEVFFGAAAAALLVAQQVMGKATRDAFFLSHHPARALPLVMMSSSVLAVVVALAVGRWLAARSPQQVVPILVALNAGLLLGAYVLAQTAPSVASVLVYLLVAATGGVLVSGFWSVVNERFDPWTAKRLVSRFGLGASLGGVGGGLLAFATAHAVPLPTMLPLTAGLNVAALVFVVLFRGDAATERSSPATGALPLQTLGAAPYLRVIALLVALSAGLEALLDFVLKSRASAQLASGSQLMAFFASYHAAVGILGLLAQAACTRGALERLGLAGTVAVRPLVVLASATVGLVDPRLWTVVLARGSYDVISNSVFRAGYELLYTPVPDRDKRAAKQVVDVAFDKVGALVGGALVLASVRLVPFPERALLVIAAGVALVLAGLTRSLHQGYVMALARALSEGKIHLEPEDVRDSTTRFTVRERDVTRTRFEAAGTPPAPARNDGTDPLVQAIADLRSGDTGRIRAALRHPRDADAAALVSHLLPLVARNDVSLEAMRALRALAPSCSGQILDLVLDPAADPVVRRRLPRLFRAMADARTVEGLLHGLAAASFEVRASCAATLAHNAARAGELGVPAERVFAAVARELEEARAGGGVDAGGDRGGRIPPDSRRLSHVFNLLAIVYDPEPLRVAERAARGRDPALRGTALEYLDTVLPRELRGGLIRLMGGASRTPREAAPGPEAVAAPDELITALRRAQGGRGASRARRGLRPRD